jgi:hypothetical protein
MGAPEFFHKHGKSMIGNAHQHLEKHGHKYLTIGEKAVEHAFKHKAHNHKRSKELHDKKSEENATVVHNGLILEKRKIDISRGKKIKVQNNYELYESYSMPQSTQGGGLQYVFYDKAILSLAQIIGVAGTPNTQNDNLSKLSWQQSLVNTLANNVFAPGIVQSGSNAAYQTNQTAVSTNTNYEIVVKSIHWEFSLMNNDNMSMEVEVYYLLANQDGQATLMNPITYWNNQLYTAQGGAGRGFAVTTSVAQTTGVAGYVNCNVPLTSPLTCKGFSKMWKTLKVEKFVLAPGSTSRKITEIIVNKTFNIQELTALSSNADYLKGTTIVPLLVCRGSTMSTIGGGAYTTSNFGTYSPISIVTQNCLKVHYGYKLGKGALPEPQYIGSVGIPVVGTGKTVLDTDVSGTFTTATGV